MHKEIEIFMALGEMEYSVEGDYTVRGQSNVWRLPKY
jgi:hypothetical protein